MARMILILSKIFTHMLHSKVCNFAEISSPYENTFCSEIAMDILLVFQVCHAFGNLMSYQNGKKKVTMYAVEKKDIPIQCVPIKRKTERAVIFPLTLNDL